MEVSVVEQRYRAVLEVRAGVPVTEVAAGAGVSRQSVHAWLRRYEQGGLGSLADRPRRPDTCPHQTSAQVEAAVCEMRREHPKWGPVRLAHELGKAGVSPVPSRMSVYRVLIRHGLVEPGLRHTGNTLSADAGANLRELMERMGHSSTRAALIYLHSTTERQRFIADQVGKAAKAALRKAKNPKPDDTPSGTTVARRRGHAS